MLQIALKGYQHTCLEIAIANTPAYKEWFSGATWEQIQDIFEDLAERFTKW